MTSCPTCGASAERGQLVCLECGGRLELDYRRATGWKPAAAVIAAVLLLAGLALVLGLRAVDDEADEQVAERPPASEPPPRERTTTEPAGNASDPLAQAKRTELAVLSGSDVPGIAARTGRRLRRDGFRVGEVTNATGPSERSSVRFARPSRRRAAQALAEELDITTVSRLDADNAALAEGAGLVVILGTDQPQPSDQ